MSHTSGTAYAHRPSAFPLSHNYPNEVDNLPLHTERECWQSDNHQRSNFQVNCVLEGLAEWPACFKLEPRHAWGHTNLPSAFLSMILHRTILVQPFQSWTACLLSRPWPDWCTAEGDLKWRSLCEGCTCCPLLVRKAPVDIVELNPIGSRLLHGQGSKVIGYIVNRLFVVFYSRWLFGGRHGGSFFFKVLFSESSMLVSYEPREMSSPSDYW
jgi:hypothetical protein